MTNCGDWKSRDGHCWLHVPSPRVELKGIRKMTLSYRLAIGAGCCIQRRSKATDLQSRRRLFADIKTVGKLASISPEPDPLLQLEESDQAAGPLMRHREGSSYLVAPHADGEEHQRRKDWWAPAVDVAGEKLDGGRDGEHQRRKDFLARELVPLRA